jgi:hypothetical protein
VNRRLIITGALSLLVAGGFASTASADSSTNSSDATRHKLCVMTPGDDPIIPGYCITWSDPTVPPLPR